MQTKPQWEEIPEFNQLAEKLVEKYPERWSDVDVDRVVAYVCTNKERPQSKQKLYEMAGETEPESLTNSKTYFIKLFQEDWEGRSRNGKLKIVASALGRIDPENPGKVLPYDRKDQNFMVKTFGLDWEQNDDGPDILEESVEFKE